MSTPSIVESLLVRLCRAAQLERVRGHTFHAGLLNSRSVVVDLGAHVGRFADDMSRRFGCRVVAVEALPELCAQIPRRVKLQVVNAAVADADGPVTLHRAADRESHSVDLSVAAAAGYRGSVDCRGLTLQSLLDRERLTHVDLLKVDIEGGEGPMFSSTSDAVLRRATQVSVQFHDHLEDSISPTEVRAICARMVRLGFVALPMSGAQPLGQHRDLLFVQLDAARLPASQRWLLAAIRLLLGARQPARRAAPPQPVAVPG